MIEYEVLIKLLMAIAIGGLIGYERQINNRPAGFRTHILVCVGATIISMIQIETIEQTKEMILANPLLANSLKADIGRMGAQVITGVGFLGAGTIIREKGLVKGLTTAASVWVVACIGLAVGLGMYFITIASTIGVFTSLVILKKVEDKFIDKIQLIDLEIEYVGDKEFTKKMQKYFNMKNIIVSNIQFMNDTKKLKETVNAKEEYICKRLIYTIEVPKHIKATKIVQDLCRIKGIILVKTI